jgi:hypothetical protein
LSGLKNVLFCKSLKKHFKDFSGGFTELHAKFYADLLLDFAIHRRQNEIQNQKNHLCKNIACSQHKSRGRLKQQACRTVTLASPPIFFHQGSYNNNSSGTF